MSEREGQWRTAAGGDAVTVTKGKEAWFDGSWGAAKGLAYRFTGSGAGSHPFVEQGWVVKTKGSVMFLRAQFGGVDAEKLMDGTWKAIAPEPATDRVDDYGRLLRYVIRARDSVNVNIRLVARGAAAPYFYRGRRGRYANRLEALAKRARAKRLGLWGACPRTPYDPYRGVETIR